MLCPTEHHKKDNSSFLVECLDRLEVGEVSRRMKVLLAGKKDEDQDRDVLIDNKTYVHYMFALVTAAVLNNAVDLGLS